MTGGITKGMAKSAPSEDSTDPGFRHGMIAARADALAAEISALAARLRVATDAKTREALAAEVSRASWAIRGIREDKAVRLAFVFAVEAAIEHIEYWRAAVIRARLDRGEAVEGIELQWRADLRTPRARKRLASPFASAEIASDVVALSPWTADASFAFEARDFFAVEFPEHARRLSIGDYRYAVQAMRGETPGKWDVLADVLEGRLKLSTTADTLRKYVRMYRARYGRR